MPESEITLPTSEPNDYRSLGQDILLNDELISLDFNEPEPEPEPEPELESESEYEEEMTNTEEGYAREALSEEDSNNDLYAEIDLSDTEGLDRFFESASEIYNEVLEYAEIAEYEQYESLSLPGVMGEEVFLTVDEIFADLVDLLKECRKYLLEQAIPVPDEKIDEMQEIYDAMIVLRNHIVVTYSVSDVDTPQRLYNGYEQPVDIDEEEAESESNDFFAEEYNPTKAFYPQAISVVSDDEEKNVSIWVAEEAARAIQKKLNKKESGAIYNSLAKGKISKSDQSAFLRIEKLDPINQVFATEERSVPSIEEVKNSKSLTKKYLWSGDYKNFIESEYKTASAFDHVLSSKIMQIETATVDRFERWLQVKHQSAFSFISGLTIAELIDLLNSRNLRESLVKENVKYEMFLAWVDLLPEMIDVVGVQEDQKFEELYTLWAVESVMNIFYEKST